jgi:hypothetical protein
VTPKDKLKGAYVLWRWGDREIENPALLRAQLEEMYDKAFTGVLATLRGTRFEFIDAKVLRTVARISQWAKKRQLEFWFQPDPRQASRSYISQTGERTQNLIVTRRPEDGLIRKQVNITKILNNKFGLLFELPRPQYSPFLQESSLLFEPSGLERAFAFQMNDHVINRETVRDITGNCHFFTNVAEGYTEVFGDVSAPEDEEWWVCAFPRFDTNVFDYAGRISNDRLQGFVENLFDACSHLDGFTWGEGGNGYVVTMGRFAVSLSLYNSFISEYQYDLRDHLYALLMDVDDGSHIKVRCDYYALLMDIVFGAQKYFYQMTHSFFRGVDVGIHHTWHLDRNPSDNLVKGSLDPWRGLDQGGSIFSDISGTENLKRDLSTITALLISTKSLGAFSNTKRAFLCFRGAQYDRKGLLYWADLMGLFSIHPVTHTAADTRYHVQEAGSRSRTGHSAWKNFLDLNERITTIKSLTRFQFPVADTALIFPSETFMGIGSQDAEPLIHDFHRLTARLFLQGVQLDVISSSILKQGKVSPGGFQVGDRKYTHLIFPYPEILDPQILEIISLLDKIGCSPLLGGCKPRYTTQGKRIPHVFPVIFDPAAEDITPILEAGVRPMISPLKHGITSVIQQGKNTLFLVCPYPFGGQASGEVVYRDTVFQVSKASQLVIYKKPFRGDLQRVL